MKDLKRNSRALLAAIAFMMVLTACGGTPPPLPPPPPSNPNGGFYGGAGGGICAPATGVLPLNPTNLPYTATLIDSYSQSAASSISTTLFYQTAPNAGLSIQNIVGTANLNLPQLARMVSPYQGQTSNFCASTTSTTGTPVPGRYASVGAIQLVMTGQVPVSMGMYLPQYATPQGGNVGTFNTPMEVRIGHSCDAWIGAEGRMYGCVDVRVDTLGVYLSLYAQ